MKGTQFISENACKDWTNRRRLSRTYYKVTSSPNSKTVIVLPSLYPTLIFPFHILPYPVQPTGFSFGYFPGFLAIFILLSSNNNNLFCTRWPWTNYEYNTRKHYTYKYSLLYCINIQNYNVNKRHICTQRNLFQILLNQTEIGLYLLFSDWFNKICQCVVR